MANPRPEAGFLHSKAARWLTVFLFAQAAVFYGFSVTRAEAIPSKRPLSETPVRAGNWEMVNEGVVEKEVQDVLKADELLTRLYANPARREMAHLFVAYFKTQRAGQAPHSPKNCLPGNGWVPSASDIVQIPVPGVAAPINANRYVVAKGDTKSVVMYWYQSRDRTVASEYTAKFYVVADALRYNRTDTALVRIVVPIDNNNVRSAEDAATDFIKSIYTPLRQHFPA